MKIDDLTMQEIKALVGEQQIFITQLQKTLQRIVGELEVAKKAVEPQPDA